MNIKDFNYIGAEQCGCVVAIHTIANPYPDPDPTEWLKGLAESLSEMIMNGYTIHFVSKDEAHRLINLDCPHAQIPGPVINDAVTEYLDGLRLGAKPVLELQRQRDLALETPSTSAHAAPDTENTRGSKTAK